MKTDKELESDVANEFEWEPSLDEANVKVSVNAGVARLTGRVRSAFAGEMALLVVSQIAGLRGYTSEILVQPRGKGSPRQAQLASLMWRSRDRSGASPR